MKRLSVLSFCLFAGISILMAQTFEGTITVTHTLRPGQEVVYSLKGAQSLMEYQGPGTQQNVKVIADASLGEYSLVRMANGTPHTRKYSMTGARAGYYAPQSVVQQTGASKQLDGYTCFEYQTVRNGEDVLVWVAPELDMIDPAQFVTAQSRPKISDFKLAGVAGLILEIHGTNTATGKPFTIHNLVSQQNIDSSIFAIP